MSVSSVMRSVIRVNLHQTIVHHVVKVPNWLMDRTEIVSVAMGILALLQTVWKDVILHVQPAAERHKMTV